MAINKLLLYYIFTPIADPAAIRLWQHELCSRLGIRGRIVVSPHGLNGTVGGEVQLLKQYARRTREYPAFADVEFRWSGGTGEEFPRLSVKVRDEIVTFGTPEEIEVSQRGVVGGGRHLTPAEVHDLVASRGEEVVFFDGRNQFEAAIGRFKGAVVPNISATRDFLAELDSGKYDELKDRPVVTYCTGGIRCEVLSSLMVNRGFSEVYQIDGGILRYGEAFGDSGLWEGALYVFDDRVKITFSDQAAVIGHCETCGAPTDDYRDCIADQCASRTLLCNACADFPVCRAHRN